MRAALSAEWLKLWSVASTWWTLAATIVTTVGGGVVMVLLVPGDTGHDLARSAVSGAVVGQAAVAGLGAAAIGDEYGSGLILATLVAVPRRGVLLSAKAAVLAFAILATGVLATATGIASAVLIRPGVPRPSLGTATNAILLTAVYLALIALLALGAAVASRSTASAATLTLGLLYLPPLLAASIADPSWQLRVQRVAPMSAGLAPPFGIGADRHHSASWSGVAIVAAWAAGALLVGCPVLRRRHSP